MLETLHWEYTQGVFFLIKSSGLDIIGWHVLQLECSLLFCLDGRHSTIHSQSNVVCFLGIHPIQMPEFDYTLNWGFKSEKGTSSSGHHHLGHL